MQHRDTRPCKVTKKYSSGIIMTKMLFKTVTLCIYDDVTQTVLTLSTKWHCGYPLLGAPGMSPSVRLEQGRVPGWGRERLTNLVIKWNYIPPFITFSSFCKVDLDKILWHCIYILYSCPAGVCASRTEGWLTLQWHRGHRAQPAGTNPLPEERKRGGMRWGTGSGGYNTHRYWPSTRKKGGGWGVKGLMGIIIEGWQGAGKWGKVWQGSGWW